ncbi:MAG: PEP-CTERM sorting domain-containing protein [Phycisphaerae bacterium]|nr:PEP-CTERM sorting domain-containing protein [Planctomycetota bacterium]MBL7220848.1 PEP-CTERM sorting domain-containing protein [Phycisphaerae bacterium]
MGQMTWGGSYSGMAHQAVTVLEIPEPATVSLLALGIMVLVRRRRLT